MNREPIKFDYNNMMADLIGEKGFTREEIIEINPKAQQAFKTVLDSRGKGMMGWTELPYKQGEIVKEIRATAAEIRKNFDYFVVLGIGGSALGPIA
ncbi:MAG TPA: glucose-6-phosphate isomerase, partial [Eubacteriales bacterium]|nr:glucose-6-phosphate isomerase [Eubacteriales bacterium]